MNEHDSAFMKKFAALIAGFVVLTFALVFIALAVFKSTRPDTSAPEQVAAIEARIAPAGGVYAGESGQMARSAAAAAAQAAAQSQVAYGGTMDGQVIYDSLCKTCHDTGAGGAPVMTRAAWGNRLDQGLETLVRHSIDGFTGNDGVMPPRGGNPSLSDEQLHATVEWMIDHLN